MPAQMSVVKPEVYCILTAFSVSRECLIKFCEINNSCNLSSDKFVANIRTISTACHLDLKNRNIINK